MVIWYFIDPVRNALNRLLLKRSLLKKEKVVLRADYGKSCSEYLSYASELAYACHHNDIVFKGLLNMVLID